MNKRKLRIAQIAPLWYALPPKKYGGIERIVGSVTEELVKRGHKVTLFASGDSQTKAKLVSPRKKCLVKDNIPWTENLWNFENINLALRQWQNFDIIHDHTGFKSIFFQGLIKTPIIRTFHNPVSGDPKNLSETMKIINKHKDETNVCFISEQARKICPIKFKKSWIVYNGINLNLFKFNNKPADYFLWVGRMESYKGIENAIEAAEITGADLLLAGKIDAQKQTYFEEKVRPRLSEKIKFLGELSQKELARLYANAKAFVYPIEWEEPFGLTMVEAMACGTPVIAFDRGSVAEVVNNNKTGFVVPFLDKNKQKNIKGIIEAMENIEKISRQDCRKWVEENFTIEKMVDNYEKVYNQLIKH